MRLPTERVQSQCRTYLISLGVALHFFCHGLASVHISLALLLVCRWFAPRRLLGYRLGETVRRAQHYFSAAAPGRLLPSGVRGGLLGEIFHAADIGQRCEGLGPPLVILGQPCSAVKMNLAVRDHVTGVIDAMVSVC